ncbi:hypothetical protein [Ruegeria profundi]
MRTRANMPPMELMAIATRHSVPIIEQFESVYDMHRLRTDARALDGVEG